MTEAIWAELADVRAQVMAATETEHSSLGEFIRHEVNERADSPLAGIILCASLPRKDSPAQAAARIHLAAAMVLLDVALSLHKLLLLQAPDTDTLDKSLVGGTVLAGDYCFSQAAVAAAHTENPQVVAIFSELLKELSEAHLRHLFAQGQSGLDEFPALFRSGGLAGAVLAGQSDAEQAQTAGFAASLADFFGDADDSNNLHRERFSAALQKKTAAYQHPRWLALLQRGKFNGN
ncbi:MAG: hypothetical protein WBO46_00480 [Caldilineaceae bacterium]